MSKVTTKYLVADKDGPIRAFYSLSEARRYAGTGYTITEVVERRYEPSKPSYGDLKRDLGEAPW